MQRIAKPAIFVAAATVTSLLFINFCNLVYQCGCESLWAGAADYCNIHDAESRHCPWCSIGWAGGAAVWATIVAAQAVVTFGWRSVPLVPRGLMALAAFPVTGGILALAIGWAKGYWARGHM
jgi:hypothetical protein